jgi:hypothetical protein
MIAGDGQLCRVAARRGLQDHPTVKQAAMLKDALLDLTHRGDFVLDPFLGSGATLIAAARRSSAISLLIRRVMMSSRPLAVRGEPFSVTLNRFANR